MKKPLLAKTNYDERILALVKTTDHKILGTWAADCAERVLPYFERKRPGDLRPRQAIIALRAWVKTGIFRMADIRGGSLAAHAAARDVIEDDVARSAARAAGQALATAHVPTHSAAAAIYAGTVIRDAGGSLEDIEKEKAWQYRHLQDLRNKSL